MLKHRFMTRLSSTTKDFNNLGKHASFSSYIDSSIEDSYENEPEVQIFEKPSLEQSNLKEFPESKLKTSLKVQQSKTEDKVSEMLNELRQGNNLAKFLESQGLSTSGINISELKEAFDKFLSKQSYKKKEISKWEEQLNNLRELTDDDKLEKWLESMGVQPSQVSLPLLKQELKRYFGTSHKISKTAIPSIDEPMWGKRLDRTIGSLDEKSEFSMDETSEVTTSTSESESETKTRKRFGPPEPLETFRGRSLIYQENTLAKKIWDDFKGMSTSKQIAVVIGITVVTAAVGFVSFRILLMMFPRVMSMNHYWAEVLSQWFMQRQDTAFQLLVQHSENVKPLSTAWANQYILWKYI